MKTIHRSWLLSALIVFVGLEPNRAPGGTITWTNTTGGSWNTPANWSPQQVPGAADTAQIAAAGTYTVTQNANVTVAGLALGGDTGAQTLLNSSYTLTLSGPSTLGTNGTLSLGGSTLTGSGLLEVRGVLSWSAGSVGRLSVLSNGLLLLSGSGDKYLKGALTNWGTVGVTGASDWRFWDGNARLVNEASGLVDVQNDRSFTTYYGGGSVWNGGTFRKSAGTGVTRVDVAFSNSGLVEVQTGTLRLNDTYTQRGGTLSFRLNCILYYNTAVSASGANHDGGSLKYCCTTPLPAGAGNITNEPLFINYAGDNLRLATNSPCIDAGHNAYALGSTDLDGSPRIARLRVDMGAYEYQGPGLSPFIAWLLQYGLPTDGSADYRHDDADPHNNLAEYLADTNPTNGLSCLRIIALSNLPPWTVYFWPSSTNRFYTLESSTNLAETVWSNVTDQVRVPGTGETQSMSDTNTGASHFYRVGAGP